MGPGAHAAIEISLCSYKAAQTCAFGQLNAHPFSVQFKLVDQQRRWRFSLNGDDVRRYYCCLIDPQGLTFEDARGFSAVSDAEAIGVVRAIAKIALDRDPLMADAHVALHGRDGAFVMVTRISTFASDEN